MDRSPMMPVDDDSLGHSDSAYWAKRLMEDELPECNEVCPYQTAIRRQCTRRICVK